MINEKDFKEIIDSITNFKEIKISDIPSIDLYMDQVTKLMDDGLIYFKRYKDDKILTKTMINNYAKDKVLFSPTKKKYSKKHMLILILIYHLKSILSISDIGKLLHSLNFSMEEEDIFKIYEFFLNIQKDESSKFSYNMMDILEGIKSNLDDFAEDKENSKIELLLFAFTLIIKANMEKRLAEKIIDEYFSK